MTFRIDGATESDPSGILASVTQSGDEITVTTGGIGISNFPDTAASWERPLEDIFGAPAAFDLGDVFRAIGRASTLSAPADLHFGMSIENVDGQRGAAWRIAAVAGQWQVQHTSKTTGTWAPWTTGATQAATQAFDGQIGVGTGNTQARIANAGLDALGITTGGAGNTSPTTQNVGSDLTRLKAFFGYVTGSGGAPGPFTFKAAHVLAKRLKWDTLKRIFAVGPARAARSTQPTTFVVAGQSNADGVAADEHAGEALQPGTSINDRGIDLTVMPDSVERAGEQRHCGPLPYLAKYASRAGATTVNILREATNGQNINACIGDFPGIVRRLAAKGWTPDYWFFAQGEAETKDPLASPAADYHARLTHYVALVLAAFPDCRVAIQSLAMHTNDYGGPGGSASYPIIEAAQRLVCEQNPDRVLLVDCRGTALDPRRAPLSRDEVHLSVDDGGGFDVVMARFRETWALIDAELVQSAVWSNPDSVVLHDDERWLGTLHVIPSPGEMEELAAEANHILSAICNDPITQDEAPGAPGILLGTFADWQPHNFGFTEEVPDYVLEQGHEYIVVSAGARLLILGKTVRSTAYAFYRFAELLGYQQLMPAPAWEVIPRRVRIAVRLSIGETSILKFVIALGKSGGFDGEDAEKRHDAWTRKNRMPVGGYSFGHAYGKIVQKYQADFNDHPEWIGSHNKFCVNETGLREKVLTWVNDQLESGVVVQTLAAADGSDGWDADCNGTHEQRYLSPSDRQMILAQHIQDEIAPTGVRLSILAYGRTSPKPNVGADPRIVVAVTDGNFDGALDWQTVVRQYQDAGSVDLVPYVYTAVWPWNLGRPGAARVFDLSLMAFDAARAVAAPGSIPGLIAEGPAAWAPFGLGYWVLAKLCTDRTTTTDVQVLRQTFLDSAFGKQAHILSDFYSVLATPAPLSEDPVHRMYQCLADALADEPTAPVKARIRDLGIYTRFLQLLVAWMRSGDICDFDAMAAWMWRARDRNLFPVKLSYSQPETWRDAFIDLQQKHPGFKFTWGSAKPCKGHWEKKDDPFTDTELDAVIAEGLINTHPMPFEPVEFSDELVYVEHPCDSRGRGRFLYAKENHSFYLFMRPGQSTWRVEHRAGWEDHHQGNAGLRVFDVSSGELVASIEVREDETTTSQVCLQENKLYHYFA